MKHLAIHIKGDSRHDAKGFYSRVMRDPIGNPMTLSDQDASYWNKVVARHGNQSQALDVTVPWPGHAIKTKSEEHWVISARGGVLRIKNIRAPLWILQDDITKHGIPPSEEFRDGRMIPTWRFKDFSFAECCCGMSVLVPAGGECIDVECRRCFNEKTA